MKRVFLLLLMLLVSSDIWAGTLEDLQKSAVMNRDIVKKSQADLVIRKEQVRETRGEFLPSVDLEYKMNRLNHDTGTGEMRENDAFQGGVSLNVFAGFKDYHNLKSARSLEKSSGFSLDSTRQDINLNVALRYLSVYRSIENLKVAEDASRLYKERYRQIELKYKVGVLKKSDLLNVKVELDNALQNERRARSLVQSSLNLLAFETGQEISLEQLDFESFANLPLKGTYEEYEPLLLERRSEIKALKKSLEASEHRVKASRAALYPRADLSASYNSYNRDDHFFGSPDNSDDDIRLQATVSINLFDGMKKYSRTAQANQEARKIGYDLRELENNLKTSLKNTLLDLDVAFDNLKVAESGKAEAKENLRVTDLSFSQGLSTSTEVLDAIFNLSRARFNLIDAYTQVFENDFRLKRLVETF